MATARKTTAPAPLAGAKIEKAKPNLAVVPAPKNGEVMTGKAYELSDRDFDARLVAALNHGATLRNELHMLVVAGLLHYATHGDFTARIQSNDPKSKQPKLFDVIGKVLSKSMQRAFVGWVVENSSLRFNHKSGQFYHNKKDSRIASGSKGWFNLEAIDGTPFYKLERDPVAPNAIDFAKRIKALIGQMQTALDEKTKGWKPSEGAPASKVKKIDHKIDASMIADMQRFAKEHKIDLTKAA